MEKNPRLQEGRIRGDWQKNGADTDQRNSIHSGIVRFMHELPPILVAEDSDDDFFFFRRAIRSAGVENPLLRFRDGSELVKFLEKIPAREIGPMQHEPWLLFVDITMPMMNGFELLEWIASAKQIPKFRPIILSGSYRTEDVTRAKALGAVDYLVKPISPTDLLATISANSVAIAKS